MGGFSKMAGGTGCAHARKDLICHTCVAQFNANPSRGFSNGAHIYTYPKAYVKLIQHHGLVVHDGTGKLVIHFDENDEETDSYYEKCAECHARGEARRRRGIRSGIRKSCFYCFSHGLKMQIVEYNVDFLTRMLKDLGTRSTRSTVSPGEAVSCATRFYEDDSFGKYTLKHNCEAFVYFCKTKDYGTKQVTRGLMVASLLILEWEFTLFCVGVKLYLNWRGRRRIQAARRNALSAPRFGRS